MILIIFMIFTFNMNSQIYSFKKGTDYERIYLNYIEIINNNNQFECSGNYYIHNYKNRALDSSTFKGIIIRNDEDSIYNSMFLIDINDKIYYYKNYKSFVYNKNQNNILFSPNINSKKISKQFGFMDNIFEKFIKLKDFNLDVYFEPNIKFMYDSEDVQHYFILNKNLDKFGFNYIYRLKFKKENFTPTYNYININEYTNLPRFEEWYIDSFSMQKEKDYDRISFKKYLLKYSIYEEVNFKKTTCQIKVEHKGNIIFDSNLVSNGKKLVIFYKESEYLDEVNFLNEIELIKLKKYIYKIQNNILYKVTKEGMFKMNYDLLSQYNVEFSPSYFVLDENNKIIDYFYGYNVNNPIIKKRLQTDY